METTIQSPQTTRQQGQYNLEERAQISQITSQANEDGRVQAISIDGFSTILEYAYRFQELDRNNGESERKSNYLKQLEGMISSDESETVIPLERVYKVGEDCDIERAYIDKALAYKRQLNPQQIKDNLKKMEASPSKKCLAKMINESALQCLQTSFPLDEFKLIGDIYCTIYKVEKKEKIKKRLFVFGKPTKIITEKKVKLLKIDNSSENFMEIFHPMASVCTETYIPLRVIYHIDPNHPTQV